MHNSSINLTLLQAAYTNLDRNSVSNRCDTYSKSFETLLNSISNAEHASFIVDQIFETDQISVIRQLTTGLHRIFKFSFEQKIIVG